MSIPILAEHLAVESSITLGGNMAIDNHYIQYDITELSVSDPCFSLIEWLTIIDGLIKRYGEDSKLRFDAGFLTAHENLRKSKQS